MLWRRGFKPSDRRGVRQLVMVGRNFDSYVLLELILEPLTPLLPFLKGERENACEEGRGIFFNFYCYQIH
jgi:hypothetical protein